MAPSLRHNSDRNADVLPKVTKKPSVNQCWLPILKKLPCITLIYVGPISFANANATLYYNIVTTSDTNVRSILVSNFRPIFVFYLIPASV